MLVAWISCVGRYSSTNFLPCNRCHKVLFPVLRSPRITIFTGGENHTAKERSCINMEGMGPSSAGGFTSHQWIALVLMILHNHGNLLDECHYSSALIKLSSLFTETAERMSHRDSDSCQKKKDNSADSQC